MLAFISVIFSETAIILSSFKSPNDLQWFNIVCCLFYYCKTCDNTKILKKNNMQRY